MINQRPIQKSLTAHTNTEVMLRRPCNYYTYIVELMIRGIIQLGFLEQGVPGHVPLGVNLLLDILYNDHWVDPPQLEGRVQEVKQGGAQADVHGHAHLTGRDPEVDLQNKRSYKCTVISSRLEFTEGRWYHA